MTVTRRVGLLVGAALVVGTFVTLPFALRHVDFFTLRRIELVAEYHTAEQVMTAAGFARDHNIFASSRTIRHRLETLPGVVAAEVNRRLPATLTILLEEHRPVALVPGEAGLLLVDAEARPLPYVPEVLGLDLPVMRHADTKLTRTLSLLLTADPDLYAEIDGVERGAGDMVILELEGRQVLWRDVPSVREIRAVEAVRRLLLAEGASFVQLDARFRDAVIVRRSPA